MARLPGHWAADVQQHNAIAARFERTARVWTPSSDRPSLAAFHRLEDAVLTGPDGLRLYLLGHRTSRILVCPLIPDDLHEDLTNRMSAPPSVAVPAEAARAAWRITDRLIPHYLAVTAQARRPSPARTAPTAPRPLPRMTAASPRDAGRTLR
ncbi:hypothetical protein ABZ726_03860 [Streptomyces hundungensis]|uniref:hypothetical protein n=1 Tax=Streptomyces hundungensis TaxID=1077946 RepID=UPI0033D5FBB0